MSDPMTVTATSNDYVYTVGPLRAFEREVDAQETFALSTLDASGNQMTVGSQMADIDTSRLFPVTVPVGLRGAIEGQTIGLHVVGIEPDDIGHMWTRPGLGLSSPGELRVIEVPTNSNIIGEYGDRRIAPLRRLHIGTLGVCPRNQERARDLGDWGGNLDTYEMGVGATLWVVAQQDGAGVFAGDVHSGIGDAEICGTGVEVSARIQLQLSVAQEWRAPAPLVMNNGRAWIIAVGKTFEAALRHATDVLVKVVAEQLGVDEPEAYLIASGLLELRVCQVVNPHLSIAVSLSGGLDEILAPPAIWDLHRSAHGRAS